MKSKELLTSSYDYTLPKELIATYPAHPRDSARLLVYDRKTNTLTHALFKDIEHFIPNDTALIFNNTKVIKARLFGHKQTGGKIELLINRPNNAYEIEVYIRGKVKPATRLLFENDLEAEVVALSEDGSKTVRFFHSSKALRFEELLPIIDAIGHVPLPPYIDRADEKMDEKEYQSVFAKKEGAIAAPTASLHFTKELNERIRSRFQNAEVTLHVGSGTFKPVKTDIITDHPMHSEYFEIPKDAQILLDSPTSILAVGTTTTRTVEYYAKTKQIAGEANLFLHPQNPPVRVNHLLTNFHLPKSTLLMLVASFVGLEKTLKLYDIAIKKRYRFYSYGDAMLIL